MSNQHRLQAAPELQDKDESIYQALMTAIVEHQLPPGSKLPEEALAEISAAGLVAYTKSIIDAADALNEMSERTGISVENLGRLQYAAKLSGVESEQLGKSLQALSGEIVAAAGGSESAIAKFKRLGGENSPTRRLLAALGKGR